MQMSDHEIGVYVDIVRVRQTSYRVIRVARPLDGWLVQQPPGWPSFLAGLSKRSVRDLTTAWAFAARSPRTIVYLPIRSSHRVGQPLDGNSELILGPRLHLVLVHHSLQLPPSKWKVIRAGLGRDHTDTIVLPVSAYDDLEPTGLTAERVKRDPLLLNVSAGTLILIGSRQSFVRQLGALRDLAEKGPAAQTLNPQAHCYVEICEIGDPTIRLDLIAT